MTILLEDNPAPGVTRLRLNRPAERNALSQELRTEIAAAMHRLAMDDTVRCVIIAGGEKVFAAGADIKSMVEASPLDMHRLGNHRRWQAITDFPKPLIAAVRGFALGGGCELAMHADIIIAGSTAQFGQPEIRVGIIPGAGGTQRLVRAIGKAKAMKLLLTGEAIDAATAYAWGLVSEVTDDVAVDDRAVELAGRIAQMPALAAEYIKELVLMGADIPLPAALTLERKSLHLLFDSEDQTEGMQAFLQKRSANFKGR